MFTSGNIDECEYIFCANLETTELAGTEYFCQTSPHVVSLPDPENETESEK